MLTMDQVAAYAYQAGFRGQNLDTAVAIAYAESTGNQYARNGIMYGLWQIDEIHLPQGTNPDALYNPLTNAQYAYKLSGGYNFTPWSTYTAPPYPYRKYLPAATEAVARMQSVNISAAQHNTVKYPAIKVEVNGNVFPAISVRQNGQAVTYVDWEVLKLINAPYRYYGSGVFLLVSPGGKQYVAQGVIYRGVTYLAWNDVPGLQNPKKIAGGFSFNDKVVWVGAAALTGLFIILR